MNTNFNFSTLKNKAKRKRAFAFLLSMVLLLTGTAVPISPPFGSITAHASASGDAQEAKICSLSAPEDTRGEYYKLESFPISYML